MIYGFCRVSRKSQNIERQVRNILHEYPSATIIREKYTGTTMDRPEWTKLMKKIITGDTIVFDSVSRMSRNAEEGYKQWMDLYDQGVDLIFLNEPHISTSVFRQAMNDQINMTGSNVDLILKGVNDYLKELAKEQIKIAFEQSEKEVTDLHERTKEGIETARLHGKTIGRPVGSTGETKKAKAAKAIMLEHAKDFGGTLTDTQCIRLTGVSRNAYYRYKKQLKENS